MTSSAVDPRSQPVVVGYDGSAWAELALTWAAEHARAAALPLRVLVARGDLHSLSAFTDEWTLGLAQEWAADAETSLSRLEAVEHDLVIADGLPGDVLVKASHEGAIVVLGSHGHHAVAGAVLGSVSTRVAREAACPVVVVRKPAVPTSRRVVVGVDGSANSLEALAFAQAYAGAHGLTVVVGHCPEPEGADLPEAIAHQGTGDASPPVELHRWHGRPAHELTKASEDAALVVVGARGLGAVAGALLGSVSAEVLHSARCPVAVVRDHG